MVRLRDNSPSLVEKRLTSVSLLLQLALVTAVVPILSVLSPLARPAFQFALAGLSRHGDSEDCASRVKVLISHYSGWSRWEFSIRLGLRSH